MPRDGLFMLGMTCFFLSASGPTTREIMFTHRSRRSGKTARGLESRCHCATHGGELAASCKRLSRRVLPADDSEARQTPSYHRHGSQNSLGLCITCSAQKRLTTKPSFPAATKKP